MWHAAKLTFDIIAILGTVAFVGWLVICLISAAAATETDHWRRMNRASNHRVGGVISP